MSRIADNPHPAIANGIPDDPKTWDIFNVKTTGCWVIKTAEKEKDVMIKLTEEEREQMVEQAGESDERWLDVMLLKEIQLIAENDFEKNRRRKRVLGEGTK